MKFLLTIRKHVRGGKRRSSTSVSWAWLAIVLVSIIKNDIATKHVIIGNRYPITATELAFECGMWLSASRIRINSLLSMSRVVVKVVANLLKNIAQSFIFMPACCRARSTMALLLIRQEACPELFDGNACRSTLIFLSSASQVSLALLNSLWKSEIKETISLVHLLIDTLIEGLERKAGDRVVRQAWVMHCCRCKFKGWAQEVLGAALATRQDCRCSITFVKRGVSICFFLHLKRCKCLRAWPNLLSLQHWIMWASQTVIRSSISI